MPGDRSGPLEKNKTGEIQCFTLKQSESRELISLF